MVTVPFFEWQGDAILDFQDVGVAGSEKNGVGELADELIVFEILDNQLLVGGAAAELKL